MGGLSLPGRQWRLLQQATDTKQVVNSVAAADLFRATLAGGLLGPSGVLRLLLHGRYRNDTAAASTLRLLITLGGVGTMFDTTAVAIAQSVNTRYWWLELLLLMNPVVQDHRVAAGFEMTEPAAGSFLLHGLNTVGTHMLARGDSSFPWDFTVADNDLVVTAQHGTANAAIDIQATSGLLEAVR